jgi:shikimate kinase
LATILTCKLNLALGNDGGGPGLVGHQTQLTEVSALADLVHLNTRKWETGSRRRKETESRTGNQEEKKAKIYNTWDMRKNFKKTVKRNCCI